MLFILVVSFTGISDNIAEKASNYYWIFDAFLKPATKMLENFFSPFKSIKGSIKNNKLKSFSSAFIGFTVAVPVLFIIIPLLSSSDIAFEAVITKIFENTALIFTAVLITLILAPIFYSLIFYLKKSPLLEKEDIKKYNGKIVVSGINAFLISISI